jgi:hypothetical protein
MKLKYFVIPALMSAAFIVSAPAHATTHPLGTLTNTLAPISNTFFGPAGMTFTDDWTFTIGPASSVAAFAADLDNKSFFELSVFGAKVIGPSSTINALVVGDTRSIPSIFLAPGNYDFQVFGTTSGTMGGGYSGLISAAVPEPETYAMMLAGIGMMGFMVRRRQNRIR